jgi:hypothetical protein
VDLLKLSAVWLQCATEGINAVGSMTADESTYVVDLYKCMNFVMDFQSFLGGKPSSSLVLYSG